MLNTYVDVIRNAMLHRRAAISIELAVGLCIAHDFRDSDGSDARVQLVNVYSTCGYDCTTPGGADYKTINRRVNAAMRLYDHIGAEAVAVALGRSKANRRVEAAQAIIAPLELYSIADVIALVSGPVVAPPTARAQRTEQPKQRRAADTPGLPHVRTAHIDVTIPASATRGELLDLVAQLLKLAEARETTVS